MQTHPCTNCKKDSAGGGSIIHGGMFFKLCPECLEDEEVIRNMNECWKNFEIEEDVPEIQNEENSNQSVDN